MRRRDFIKAIAVSTAWPLASQAEQPSKLPTIGYLGASTPSAQREWVAAFVQRLHELNRFEGRNVAIEYRWAEGRSERFAEIAAEFVQLNVNVIVTSGTLPVLTTKSATTVIPIVFAAAADPVGTGIVSSLSRPGGNATGLSLPAPDIAGKRLELLREVVPGLRKLALMADVDSLDTTLVTREVHAAARALGLEVETREIRQAADIEHAFEGLKSHTDALYIASDPLMTANINRINALALNGRLPTMHPLREYAEAGGISYGPSFPHLFRRAADYVDKILNGTKPSEIPVEQPTTLELVINVMTAKALGISIPATLLARADEVIE
jgi:putative ABC transport system substrate-binding protein